MAGRYDEHARDTDLFDKGRIVADHDDGARIVAEIFADDFLGFWVKMVGRFVKNDEIGALKEDFTEGDTGFFARGEDLDFFENVITVEEKITEHAAEFGVGEIVGLDIFEDGAAAVEDFELLSIVGNGSVLAKNNRARVGLEITSDEL